MKVLTPDGWSKFSKVKKIKRNKILEITFENGEVLKCTPDHKIYIEEDVPVWAELLSENDFVLYNNSKVKIKSIKELNGNFDVYDICDIEKGNRFYYNGFLVSNCEEFYTANYPTLSSFKNSKLIIISTPNGMYNKFWELYTKARDREEMKEWKDALNSNNEEIIKQVKEKHGERNGFIRAKYDWRSVPTRDEKWAEIELANSGKIKFSQEYGCVHGDTLIDIDKFGKMKIKDLFDILKDNDNDDIVNNKNNFKVLTPNGYKDFSGIRKLIKPSIKILTKNGIDIIVSHDHIFSYDEKLISASSLYKGDVLSYLDTIEEIMDINFAGELEVYDLLDVSGKHIYFTNGFISHNCEFLGSTATVIDSKALERLIKETSGKEPLLYDLGGKLRIYEKPIPNLNYILGVDPAKGTRKTRWHNSNIKN